MDFSYDDGRGPVSTDSPFIQNNLAFKENFACQKRWSSPSLDPLKYCLADFE